MVKVTSGNVVLSLAFLLVISGAPPSPLHAQTYTAYFSAVNTPPVQEESPLSPGNDEDQREEPRRLITFFTPTSSLQLHSFLTWVPPSPLLIIPARPVPYIPARSFLPVEPTEPLPPEPEPLVGDISFEIDGEATFRVLGPTALTYRIAVDQIRSVTAIELQLVPLEDDDEEEDLVIADLLSRTRLGSGILRGVVTRGTLQPRDFLGPLAGQPMDEFIHEIESGNVYLVIYTQDYPYFGLRGRLY